MARPTLPTETKKRRGTLQPCRTNFNEPQFEAAMPECPAHLSEIAREVWGRVCLILSGKGVLTVADTFALECLCESYADMRYAREALKHRGFFLTHDGKPAKADTPQEDLVFVQSDTYQSFGEGGSNMWRPYPERAMIADAERRFKSWCASFGMTPADRSKISAIPAKTVNKFTALAEQAKAFSSRPN